MHGRPVAPAPSWSTCCRAEGGAARTVLAKGEFRGDSVDAELGHDDLKRLTPGEYRLRFRIRSGSLYSYRLAAGG